MVLFLFAARMSKYKTCSGSRTHQLYSPALDTRGQLTLLASGTVDSQELINSYRESTDLAFISSRLLAGDGSVLRAGGQYLDIADAPTCMADVLNAQIAARNTFDALPPATRAAFGDSFATYLSTAGSEAWLAAMGVQPVADPAHTPEEVTPDA